MIAYYCWTDTLLINALKVKTGPLQSEEGDLFVLLLPRVTRELVDQIRAMGCFRKVILIEPPQDPLFGRFQKLVKLLRYGHYRKALQRQLADAAPHYDRMISGGLWSYTIPMRDLLAGDKGTLPLSMLEEGAANYGGYEIALWCDPKSRFRDRLFRLLFYRSAYGRTVQALDELYLMRPEACSNPGKLTVKSFPFFTPAYERLVEHFAREEAVAPYRDRKVSVYLQPEPEADRKKTVAIIRELTRRYGPEQIVVRPHPDHRLDWDASDLDPAVEVDRGAVPFECILPRVDWSDKVMVSRASSCMFYPLYGLGQQPTVYFVFNMFSNGDEFLIRKLSARMQAFSSQPDRVRIPADFETFQSMLGSK